MLAIRLLLLAPVVLLTACTRLKEDAPPQGPADGASDAGIPPRLTLTLTEPGGTAHTRGTVQVQLRIQGETPQSVELLVDDQPLTSLQAPYLFSWDTRSLAEGTYRLAARARLGDETFASEVRDVVVDRTPPRVVARMPTPGAQGVWARQPIEVTFSEPMKASTLTSNSVKLFVSGAEVSSAPSLSTDGKTLTLAPATLLTVPNSLQATVTAELTDLAGNPLVAPSDEWGWSLPAFFPLGELDAVPGDTSAEGPSLDLDSEGRPYVVWREQVSADKGNIYVSRWNGSAWEAVGGALNSAPTVMASDVGANLNQVIQVDSSNAPIVAWIEARNTERGIHVARWSNNAWVPLSGPIHGYSPFREEVIQSVALQLDTQGRPVIVWESTDDTCLEACVSKLRWTGQQWQDIAPQGGFWTSQPQGQAYPNLALDHSDDLVLAYAISSWEVYLYGIIVYRWDQDSIQRLGWPLGDISSPIMPSLVIDPSDAPIAAWSQQGNGAYDVHAARWTAGGWQLLGDTLSAAPGNTDALGARLAMDGSGHLFLTWCEAGQGHLRQWNGSAWEPLGEPVSCASGFAVDGAGTPFVASLMKVDPASQVSVVSILRYNH